MHTQTHKQSEAVTRTLQTKRNLQQLLLKSLCEFVWHEKRRKIVSNKCFQLEFQLRGMKWAENKKKRMSRI